MLLAGKKVFVGRFVPRKERIDNVASNPKFNNVFVKNLPKDTTEEQLKVCLRFSCTCSYVRVRAYVRVRMSLLSAYVWR